MLAQKIKSEVLELKSIDKIDIAEFIFESLDKTDDYIEKQWINESEARYEAYKSGEVRGDDNRINSPVSASKSNILY
ncbi:MAG: addiction module protein [Victivallaceae bacterium]|nr:addiction module protein [Victivallaceae bacterium]